MNAEQRRKRSRAEMRRVLNGGMVFSDPRCVPAWTKKTAAEVIAETTALIESARALRCRIELRWLAMYARTPARPVVFSAV